MGNRSQYRIVGPLQDLSLDPRNAEVHNDLGIVLDEQGDLDQAKAHLETALQIDPHYALAHNNLGGILSRLGDLSRARLHQERAVSIDPEFSPRNFFQSSSLRFDHPERRNGSDGTDDGEHDENRADTFRPHHHTDDSRANG